eukprot:11711949-Heterocapsa_arctica.AAC.1
MSSFVALRAEAQRLEVRALKLRAGSEEVSTLKPKSSFRAAVPRDWFCIVSRRPCRQGSDSNLRLAP